MVKALTGAAASGAGGMQPTPSGFILRDRPAHASSAAEIAAMSDARVAEVLAHNAKGAGFAAGGRDGPQPGASSPSRSSPCWRSGR